MAVSKSSVNFRVMVCGAVWGVRDVKVAVAADKGEVGDAGRPGRNEGNGGNAAAMVERRATRDAGGDGGRGWPDIEPGVRCFMLTVRMRYKSTPRVQRNTRNERDEKICMMTSDGWVEAP
jgi:hypothetical protein